MGQEKKGKCSLAEKKKPEKNENKGGKDSGRIKEEESREQRERRNWKQIFNDSLKGSKEGKVSFEIPCSSIPV